MKKRTQVIRLLLIIFHLSFLMGCFQDGKTPSSYPRQGSAQKLGYHPSPQQTHQSISDSIDQIVNKYVEAGDFSGTVLVAKNGTLYFNKAYGLANITRETANTLQNRFAIASLTKAFTAMAIMQLQEKGLLNVNDTLDKYLPEYPHAREMTVHQVLTHTSGLPANPLFNPYWDVPLSSPPGTKYEYSNSNYLLLEKVIEKLSGESYDKHLRKNIFQPLDMKDTGYSDTMRHIAHAATGYIKEEDGEIKRKYVSNIHLGGAGGLYSTVEDLWKWDQALYTEKLVSRKTIEQIFTPDPVTIQTLGNRGYGYGWIIALDKSWARHQGIIDGSNSFTTHRFNDHASIIILSNRRWAPTDRMTEEILQALPTEK